MKTISFVVPCYNSAGYMDTCIESLLDCADDVEDVEIIIVDDGSAADDTAAKADAWEAARPGIVRAVHQANGGHGAAVNTGLARATGLYFKVVDSDDWLDPLAARRLMACLRAQRVQQRPIDLVVANYIYDHVDEGRRTVIGYHNVFPVGRRFTWEDTHRFLPGQYLLMHSVVYRTQLLRDTGLQLPRHCFYVDNIFVYVPLPFVDSLYYLDVDLYHYFIGREDQSVHESVMLRRIDQQLRITRYMIDAVKLPDDVVQPKLRRYMTAYLSMMMCICSIFLRMDDTPAAELKRAGIWAYLKAHNPGAYGPVRRALVNLGVNLPHEAGRRVGIAGYRLAQRLFKFN